METITWKNSDLSGKRFDFETNTDSLGTLTVLSVDKTVQLVVTLLVGKAFLASFSFNYPKAT